MAVIALVVLTTDGRPVFYRQVRVGKGRKNFLIWKFRSMCRDAEKATGAVWSSKKDDRVTKIGKWLRATHLDELPQVVNILAGDMHLVGPRPERPEFVENLAQDIPGYHRRHLVRPGITGLAQVKQGYDACLGDVAKKVALDVSYIETASLSKDLKILWLTIPYVACELWFVIRTRIQSISLKRTAWRGIDPSSSSRVSIEAQIQTELEDQIQSLTEQSSQRSAVPRPKLATFNRTEHWTQKVLD